MESRELRKAIEFLSPKHEIGSSTESLMICRLLSFARQFLAVMERPEMPRKIFYFKRDFVRNLKRYTEAKIREDGWNSCHDAFLPLLVAKENELARIKKEKKQLEEDGLTVAYMKGVSDTKDNFKKDEISTISHETPRQKRTNHSP